jgi:hypothetical protein
MHGSLLMITKPASWHEVTAMTTHDDCSAYFWNSNPNW